MNRRARPVFSDLPDALESVPAEGADGRTGAEELVLAKGLDHRLGRALRALSPAHGGIVLLVDVDGLSYQEAAELLDVPIGTVMSRLHRARHRLRRHLEAQGWNVAAGG